MVRQRNKFSVGEQIEVMKPDGRNVAVCVRSIQDETGMSLASAPHPKQVLYIDLECPSAFACDQYDILRKKEED